MPLILTKKTAVKGRGVPLYEQLANELRRAIVAGELRPGDALPTEAKICELTGLSREPVRKALAILAAEGRTTPRTGWPTLVAEQRRPRLMGPARYRDLLGLLRRGEPLPRESAFTAENGARWWDYHEDRLTFAQEAATALDQELLQIPEDAEVWRRRFVRSLRGKPYEIVASAIPLEVAAGTILMDIDAEPTPGGTLEALFLNGYDPYLARHTVVGRPASVEERELLKMKSADWVYDLLEIFTTADGTVIQAARTIMPMSGTILEFETDLSAA